jgi:hypothetical protein
VYTGGPFDNDVEVIIIKHIVLVHGLQGPVGGAAPGLVLPINALEAPEDVLCCLSTGACFIRHLAILFPVSVCSKVIISFLDKMG